MIAFCRNTFFVICVIFIGLFPSCSRHDEVIPRELVDIDSILTRGDYRKGSILLDEYEDHHYKESSEAVVMYHKLMRAFLRCRVGGDPNRVSLVDSLCQFYQESGRQRENALSLFIMSDTYRKIKEYPQALECALQVEKIAKEGGMDDVLCWSYREIGLIYKNQRMYDEAQYYFQLHSSMAEKLQDMRHMIFALSEMGFVYTYKSNVDSTLYCIRKCIELAKSRKDSMNYLPTIQSMLYDIYIQIEAYDSVKNVMPRDSLNYDNWAYYYQGVGIEDSAIYYFNKCLNNYDVYVDRGCLQDLIGLEEKRGNLKEVVALYKKLEVVQDSIRKLDKEMETKRTSARYDYEQLKQQRDSMAVKKERLEWTIVAGLLFVLLLALLAYLYMNNRWKKKDAELEREKLLRHEEEARRMLSERQLADNALQQQHLERQLTEAAAQNDTASLRRLQSEADMLAAENKLIETRQQRRQLLLDDFMNSDLYRRIKLNSGNPDFRLTEEEWDELSVGIDRVYDNLTQRIRNLANLSSTELRVVYLLKLGVQPADISNMLCKSKSAVSMIRTRMYKKIFGKNGQATELDEYIRNF